MAGEHDGFLMVIFTVAVPIWTLEYFSSYKNFKKRPQTELYDAEWENWNFKTVIE